MVDDAAFWAKVNQSDDGHWYWLGTKNWSGYGNLLRDGKRIYAHRYAYILLNGPLPPKACLLHSCDIRHCVRPDHLRIGSRRENSLEMVERGRSQKGESHSGAILTEDAIKAIFACRQAGLTQKRIATAFGVSRQEIGLILAGKRWGHI